MKIVFMGTPDFAEVALEALIAAEHEVVLAVTQPDKERGRGKEISFSPVKKCALKHNIPIFQPDKIKKSEHWDRLKEAGADIFVVAAFGQILPKEVLAIPPMGCINIHASLLPKLRGAAPIQWSILNGDEYTGITIMQMDEGLDTGYMLLQKSIPIEKSDTGESLFNKLAKLGGEVIVEALPLIERGKIIRTPQDDTESTYAGMLNKSMGEMDFNLEAKVLERYVRGLNSWPSAYTYIDGKVLKIWESHVADNIPRGSCRIGEVCLVDEESIYVNCQNGILAFDTVQLEGKKRMSCGDFLRGYNIKAGTILGR